jgi:hypothetical protein
VTAVPNVQPKASKAHYLTEKCNSKISLSKLVGSGPECHNDSASSYGQRVFENCNRKIRHVPTESLTNVVSRDSRRQRPESANKGT